VKTKVKGWSVAQQKLLEKIKPDTHPELAKQIEEQANDRGIADVYGADWKQHVDKNGNPQEQGIGSTRWLMNVSASEDANVRAQADRHFAAISKFIGPAAATAERERIQRLIKGK